MIIISYKTFCHGVKNHHAKFELNRTILTCLNEREELTIPDVWMDRLTKFKPAERYMYCTRILTINVSVSMIFSASIRDRLMKIIVNIQVSVLLLNVVFYCLCIIPNII